MQARKKSVAFFLTSLGGGGAERATLSLIPPLEEQGYEITLIVSKRCGELARSVPDGTEVIDLRSTRMLRTFVPFVRIAWRRRFDVIIAVLPANCLLAIWARPFLQSSTRVVITQHGMLLRHAKDADNWKFRVLPLLYRLSARWADAVVDVSSGAALELSNLCRMRADRVRVITNPVITSEFDVLASAPIDEDVLKRDSRPLFVAVGRLIPLKQLAVLIEAFAILLRRRPARLAIIGDGPLRSELEGLCAQLKVTDDVIFTGFLGNPLPYIREATALVLTSKFESFGNVIVEALAIGTPVISTDCPWGPGEILDHGRYGTLVPIGDCDALAAAMEAAVDMRTPRDALRMRGREYSAARVAEQYAALIEELSQPQDGRL